MTHSIFFRIFVFAFIIPIAGCNGSDKSEPGNGEMDIPVAEERLQDAGVVPKKDSIPIWIYDHRSSMPLRRGYLRADTISHHRLIDFINFHKGEEKIFLEFEKISGDTIFVKIEESAYLTQQIGTTGADAYISTTTFMLTELKGINYVNFSFIEGDHAVPGTYNREFFTSRTV